MIALAVGAFAQEPGSDPAPLPLEGLVLEPVGGGSGVQLATSSVLGGDGATTAISTRGRVRWKDTVFAVSLPFATWRDPSGRDAGLGNLTGGVWLDAGPRSAVGVVGHVPLGHAWTWVNEVEEIWPGAGLDVAYRADQPTSGPVTWLARVAGGFHTSGGYAPIPGFYAKVALAGGADVAAGEHFGLLGEGSVAWWDTSPFDVSALVRADVAGFRARAGLLLPLASWAGAQPSPVPSGVREATLRVDLCAQW